VLASSELCEDPSSISPSSMSLSSRTSSSSDESDAEESDEDDEEEEDDSLSESESESDSVSGLVGGFFLSSTTSSKTENSRAEDWTDDRWNGCVTANGHTAGGDGVETKSSSSSEDDESTGEPISARFRAISPRNGFAYPFVSQISFVPLTGPCADILALGRSCMNTYKSFKSQKTHSNEHKTHLNMKHAFKLRGLKTRR
jgi:hypothetical protein